MNAVGGRQNPLWVDDGAPTDVHPGSQVIAVGPQADLPWPLPLGGTMAPRDAHQHILRHRCCKQQTEGQEPSAQPATHTGAEQVTRVSPGSWEQGFLEPV